MSYFNYHWTAATSEVEGCNHLTAMSHISMRLKTKNSLLDWSAEGVQVHALGEQLSLKADWKQRILFCEKHWGFKIRFVAHQEEMETFQEKKNKRERTQLQLTVAQAPVPEMEDWESSPCLIWFRAWTALVYYIPAGCLGQETVDTVSLFFCSNEYLMIYTEGNSYKGKPDVSFPCNMSSLWLSNGMEFLASPQSHSSN